MKPVTISPAAMMLVLCLTAAMAVNEVPFRGCSNELVALSPCLPYLASPPNNRSSLAFPPCCNAFSAIFSDTSRSACLCYLVRQPSLLGFPLNTTRILSLSFVCPSRNANQTTANTTSLRFLCEKSESLPPLGSTTGMILPYIFFRRSLWINSPAAASTSTPPESVVSSSIPEDYSPEPVPNISTLKPADSSNYRSLPGISLFFTPICTYLLH
uniref:Bifunctional inhibitor/plant lipid transfer protein/seed storage helical domain-containing protein n=1 Tax=Nelumbo nucifera TaxID=4432 RepID=A0A822ZX33_NELNU|nr:TPA_asm: hypothetical protein HUJ06_017842 [Nelumbo nucifera]